MAALQTILVSLCFIAAMLGMITVNLVENNTVVTVHNDGKGREQGRRRGRRRGVLLSDLQHFIANAHHAGHDGSMSGTVLRASGGASGGAPRSGSGMLAPLLEQVRDIESTLYKAKMDYVDYHVAVINLSAALKEAGKISTRSLGGVERRVSKMENTMGLVPSLLRTNRVNHASMFSGLLERLKTVARRTVR